MIFKAGAFWQFILSRMAKAQGFLDPITVLQSLQKFSRPSEVWVPTELLRSGAVLHARGLVNSQAIQHNLDWIWPFWVKRQFNPKDEAFIPRAFSMTHINLSHRNWTAVGFPGYPQYPIVDPRGLVTPFFDSWSLDFWIIREGKLSLLPSEQALVEQRLEWENNLNVSTHSTLNDIHLSSNVEVQVVKDTIQCNVSVKGFSQTGGWLVASLRPYNPEGISFIHKIKLLQDEDGWKVNDKHCVQLNVKPTQYIFSNYHCGDVYNQLFRYQNQSEIKCDVGMATAAALYPLEPNQAKQISLTIPLEPVKKLPLSSWSANLQNACELQIPDEQMKYLYDAALRVLVLFSPDNEIFPGPYTYRHFWFRDATLIMNAMISVGLTQNMERIIDHFPKRQTTSGYFLSQDGEWDANGEVLWVINRYLKMMNRKIKPEWVIPVIRAAKWIQRKRVHSTKDPAFEGLLPAGFSAEHFGPSDCYYWDDFWAVAGLRAAGEMINSNNFETAQEFQKEADHLLSCTESSLNKAQARLGHKAMPASPLRRMDTGAIGNLISSFPLQIFPNRDLRVLSTVEFLLNECFQPGGFYHEISHSGINAYLTMHVAQVLLRAGDHRFLTVMREIGNTATSTGQWPEAIHPRTKGGCMGDGQHTWAAAEWVLLIHHLFVREEEWSRTVILCSGIPEEWLKEKNVLKFGPAKTLYGEISITVECNDKIKVSWDAKWFDVAPNIEIHLPGHPKVTAPQPATSMQFENVTRNKGSYV